RHLRVDLGGAACLGVEHVLKARKSPAARITRLSQQFPRLFRVIAGSLRRMLARDSGWRKMIGRLLARAGDLPGDSLAINRQAQRPPDSRIVKRLFGGVEPDEIGAE